MELLTDTDFIVKMGRYSLLVAFVDLMAKHGHAQPFRHLYEIRAMLAGANRDPANSRFGSRTAWGNCHSFVTDGQQLGDVVDYDVVDELDDIVGVDAGEALLVEYAMRTPDAVIVTGDKNFIDGMALPNAKRFREALKGRIIHLEHIVFAIGTAKAPSFTDVRKAVFADEDCDRSVHGLLRPDKSEAQAVADLFAATKGLNSRSLGAMPAPLCPPFIPVKKPPSPPP